MTVIRPATAQDDFGAVLALIREAFAYMDGLIDPPSSLHRLTAGELAAIAAPEVLLLAHAPELAEAPLPGHPPELAGCVRLTPKGDALYIGKLSIRPALQGRGIGRALVAAAEAEARGRGLSALELQTRVELAGNHAAFAAMDFRQTGATAHPGYGRPTSFTFRKDLT